MNTIAPQLSTRERLQKYIEYNQIDHLCLDDNIEEIYRKETFKLKNDQYNYCFQLDIDDLLDIMDQISKSKCDDFSDLNILYDKEENKICLLDDDMEWNVSLVDKAIRIIIDKSQDGYLHEYERYIVKKLHKESGQLQQELKESLTKYYHFLACFDVQPMSIANDSVFFGNKSMNSFTVNEEFYSL